MLFSQTNLNLRHFYAWNQYSKQLPVISSIEYKQVVRKVRLSELLTNKNLISNDGNIRFSKRGYRWNLL